MHKTVLGVSIVAGIAAVGSIVRATSDGGVSSVLQTLDQLWLTQDGQSIGIITEQTGGYLPEPGQLVTEESPRGIAGSVGDSDVIELSRNRMDDGLDQTTQDGIWIPRGALRDGSIVRDDIDRSGLDLDTPLDCDP
jgi:hypothetical protein